jgi:hypothetical protein
VIPSRWPFGFMAFLALFTSLAVGCGSSPPSSATASQAGATLAPSQIAKFGQSVTVEDLQGFPFKLSVTAVKLVVQADTYGHGQLIAPPGQAYIAFRAHVANATTDRPEPMLRVQDGVSLSVSKAIVSKVQLPTTDGEWFCRTDPCSRGWITVVRDGVTLPATLPVGGSADVSLVCYEPVLSTAPVRDISVTWLVQGIKGYVAIPSGPG